MSDEAAKPQALESQLAPARMEQIRQEEIFREEVRKSLASKTPKGWGSRVWGFLNTSLGIWFLSSVLIASGSWWFTLTLEKAKTASKREETKFDLTREIASRLYTAHFAAQDRKKESERLRDSYFNTAAAHYISAKQDLDEKFYDPQYQNRSFRALLFELKRLAPTSEQPTLTLLRMKYDDIARNADTGHGEGWYISGSAAVPAEEMKKSLAAEHYFEKEITANVVKSWLGSYLAEIEDSQLQATSGGSLDPGK